MGLMLMDRVGSLRQAQLFSDFSSTELQELAAHCLFRKLHREEALIYEGEPANGLFVLTSGCVRVYREGADGREQVLYLERPVNTLNEIHIFETAPHAASISAAEDSVVLTVPSAYCKHLLARSPSFASNAMASVRKRLAQCFDLVHSLSLLSVEQRLAQFLLQELRHRGPHASEMELQFNNPEIGAVIGAVREGVSRAFGKLQQRGLIEVHGRTVRLRSKEQLERFVCSKRSSIEAAAG